MHAHSHNRATRKFCFVFFLMRNQNPKKIMRNIYHTSTTKEEEGDEKYDDKWNFIKSLSNLYTPIAFFFIYFYSNYKQFRTHTHIKKRNATNVTLEKVLKLQFCEWIKLLSSRPTVDYTRSVLVLFDNSTYVCIVNGIEVAWWSI